MSPERQLGGGTRMAAAAAGPARTATRAAESATSLGLQRIALLSKSAARTGRGMRGRSLTPEGMLPELQVK